MKFTVVINEDLGGVEISRISASFMAVGGVESITTRSQSSNVVTVGVQQGANVDSIKRQISGMDNVELPE